MTDKKNKELDVGITLLRRSEAAKYLNNVWKANGKSVWDEKALVRQLSRWQRIAEGPRVEWKTREVRDGDLTRVQGTAWYRKKDLMDWALTGEPKNDPAQAHGIDRHPGGRPRGSVSKTANYAYAPVSVPNLGMEDMQKLAQVLNLSIVPSTAAVQKINAIKEEELRRQALKDLVTELEAVVQKFRELIS